VDFGGLAVRVSGGDALAKGFDAAHLRLDPDAGVVSCPPLPKGSAIVPGRPQGFVSNACRRTVFLPRPPVLADRNDRDGVARDDGAKAAARVIGPVSGHGGCLG